MSQPGRTQRLRLSVANVDEATFELAPDDVSARLAAVPEVRPLKLTNVDRTTGQRRYEVTIDGWIFTVLAEPAARAELRERAGQATQREQVAGRYVVKAQLPGRVARLWVAEGDTVEAGQPLLAIEAMKMENEVRALQGGTVAAIKVSVGASVALGNELLVVE
jgi:biotin carboxyl carrier protein